MRNLTISHMEPGVKASLEKRSMPERMIARRMAEKVLKGLEAHIDAMVLYLRQEMPGYYPAEWIHSAVTNAVQDKINTASFVDVFLEAAARKITDKVLEEVENES